MRFITKLNQLLGIDLSTEATEAEIDNALDTALENDNLHSTSTTSEEAEHSTDTTVSIDAVKALEDRVIELEGVVATLTDSNETLLDSLATVEKNFTDDIQALKDAMGKEINALKVSMNTPQRGNTPPIKLPEAHEDKVTVSGDFISQWLN